MISCIAGSEALRLEESQSIGGSSKRSQIKVSKEPFTALEFANLENVDQILFSKERRSCTKNRAHNFFAPVMCKVTHR